MAFVGPTPLPALVTMPLVCTDGSSSSSRGLQGEGERLRSEQARLFFAGLTSQEFSDLMLTKAQVVCTWWRDE